MDEMLNAAPEPALSGQMLTMSDAANYMEISRTRLREAIDRGEIRGTSKGPETRGPGGGWRIPKAELDRLRAEGKLKPLRKKKVKAHLNGSPERMSITEAAQKFGLGESTLGKYVQSGKLPAERVQLGPGKRKTFVRTADVAALREQIPITKRGRQPKTGVTAKRAQITAAPDLNAELLRIADLVRAGQFTVSKLSVALEFTGGGE